MFHSDALSCVRFLFTENTKYIKYPAYFIQIQKRLRSRKKPAIMKSITEGAIRKKYQRSKASEASRL